MSTTASPNGQLELGERCRALERECEELRERLVRLENPQVPPRRRVRAIVADALFVLLAGIVVAAMVGGIAIAAGVWKLDESEPSAAPTRSAPATTVPAEGEADAEEGPFAGGAVTQDAPAESARTDATATDATTDATATTAVEGGAGATAVPVQLEAAAVGGACWLQVRRGGAEGKVVWEGILAAGDTANFEGKQFWIRVGDPTNLRLELNGEPVADLPTLAADLLITETGASVVPPG